MAELLRKVMVELQELSVSILVPDDYYYVSVDQSGAIYAYELVPEYNECEGYWERSYGDGYLTCGETYLGMVSFESNKERELCKQKVWKVGE